ncbi:MAG: CUB domain-containing protein [Flavobacteriales bacterium]|nr:CUB domain-containing protein [Flavobacteriales bacterium]
MATGSSHTVTVTPSGYDPIANVVMQIYSSTGPCAGLTQVAGGCVNATTAAAAETLTFGTTVASQTYYVRVHSFAATAGSKGTFVICVAVPPPPACTNTLPATGNNTINTCSGVICDSGGAGNYVISSTGYTVITPTAGNLARLTFNDLDLEDGWDFLTVYDGVGLGGAVLLHATGNAIPAAVTSRSRSLTVQLWSDPLLLVAASMPPSLALRFLHALQAIRLVMVFAKAVPCLVGLD